MSIKPRKRTILPSSYDKTDLSFLMENPQFTNQLSEISYSKQKSLMKSTILAKPIKSFNSKEFKEVYSKVNKTTNQK